MDYRANRRRRGKNLPSLNLKKLRFHSFINVLTVSKLSKYAFFGFIGLVLLIPILFIYYSFQVPKPGQIAVSKYSDATRIYDRHGELLYSVYAEQNRTYVTLDKIAKDVQEATIAIEDENFYKNKGFDPLGPLRIAKNVIFNQRAIGASTITQQLVKNVLLTNERSLPRKIKELILAIQVDSRFSKDQILEMYMNNIGYGGTSVGIEAGSQMYFGKSAHELSLPESVFLAGLPQNPSIYSPFTGNKYYVNRSKAVLAQMVDNKYITQKEADDAIKKIENFKFSPQETTIKAPHFVLYVKELLARQFGEQMVERGGLQVTTTLDYKIQKEAQAIVKEEVEKLKGFNAGNGAAVVTDPKTGEILAMVGSKDYFGDPVPEGCTPGKNCIFEPNFNATTGRRQPGSSLKPVIYAKGLEEGYTAGTMFMDVKTTFQARDSEDAYTPGNYSGKFQGPVQMRFALGNSLNIPAVKMLAMVGIKDAMQKAYDMGIENWEPTEDNMRNVGLSLVLGGREATLLEEMTAYGVFANKGVKKDLVSLLKVTDNKGKKMFEHKDRTGEKVLSEEISFIISHMLLDNNARVQEFGTGSYLVIPGKTVSVKTGTTDKKKDNWAIGYTPSYVVGVWVGNNDNSEMNPKIASGVTGASPIWNRLMRLVLKDKSDEQFAVPSNVAALQIDAMVGGQSAYGMPTRTEYFVKGTEPTTKSPVYRDKDGKVYYWFREDDPVSQDGKNRWQEGITAWIEQNHKDDEKYHPPSEITGEKQAEKKEEEKKDEEKKDEPTETPQPSPTPTGILPTL